MYRLKYILLFLLILSVDSQAAEISHKEILHQADRARGNVTGIIWPINLQTNGWRNNKSMELVVHGRGFDVHGKALTPARSKGDLFLMVKGNMWFYKPGLSKPIPISRRQKLMGDAAFGDIAATNYADKYLRVFPVMCSNYVQPIKKPPMTALNTGLRKNASLVSEQNT